MASNLLYEELSEELKAVLKVGSQDEEYRIEVFLKMAVRDVMREFIEQIGTKTTDALPLVLETDPVTEIQRSRIYLPDDCWSVRQVMLGNGELKPVPQDVFEKYKRQGSSITSFISTIGQRNDGRIYLETYPTIGGSNVATSVTYRVASDDVGRIPEVYKNVIIYGTAKHWYTFVQTENPVMKSQMAREYKNYIAQLRVDVSDAKETVRRPYEVEWERQFTFFSFRNDRAYRR
jgi:hypothetical protein